MLTIFHSNDFSLNLILIVISLFKTIWLSICTDKRDIARSRVALPSVRVANWRRGQTLPGEGDKRHNPGSSSTLSKLPAPSCDGKPGEAEGVGKGRERRLLEV